MKRSTARLLRGVLRLIEDDLREVADSVVEIDERTARHNARINDLEERLQLQEGYTLDLFKESPLYHSRRV